MTLRTKLSSVRWWWKTVLGLAFALLLLLLLILGWCLNFPAAIPINAAPALPQGFIWGVSSSAFQSEGGPVDSVWHHYNAAEKTQDRYGKSVDFRHRYREDVALARELGVNTYRIGINWARLEPQPGKIDEVELAYYDDLILSIKQAGMAPLITLDHFDYPNWVGNQGGWANPKTVKDFTAYADLVAGRYHQDVRLWITFNEEMASILAQPFLGKAQWSEIMLVRANIVAAHRQTYDLIHRLDAGAMVTSNIFWLGDRFGSRPFRQFSDWLFLDQVADKCDVIAVDYYFADLPEMIKAGPENWKVPPEPAGLYRALMFLKEKYPNKPLLVAEAGMATEDGKQRTDGVTREGVLRDGLYWTQRARADGANVVGYMVWSLTDNFEWGSYKPRFGLYTVDALKDPELKRIPTAAVPAYQELIRNNGVPADYRPVTPR
jgi:beta-glucosidase